MQAYLLSAFSGPPVDSNNFAFLWLRESAEQDPFGKHRLNDDPEHARIILFGESHAPDHPYFLSVRHRPVYRRFAEKCSLSHDDDIAVAALPGISPSIRTRDYLADRCRGGGYIARIARNDFI